MSTYALLVQRIARELLRRKHTMKTEGKTRLEGEDADGEIDEEEWESNYEQEEFTNRSLNIYWLWLKGRQGAARVGKGLSCSASNLTIMLECQHWLEANDLRHRYGANLQPYFDYWLSQQSTQEPASESDVDDSPRQYHLANKLRRENSSIVMCNKNFFLWLDEGDGKHTSLPQVPRAKLENEKVQYLDDEELAALEVVVDETGLLRYKLSNELLHTGDWGKDLPRVASDAKLASAREGRGGGDGVNVGSGALVDVPSVAGSRGMSPTSSAAVQAEIKLVPLQRRSLDASGPKESLNSQEGSEAHLDQLGPCSLVLDKLDGEDIDSRETVQVVTSSKNEAMHVSFSIAKQLESILAEDPDPPTIDIYRRADSAPVEEVCAPVEPQPGKMKSTGQLRGRVSDLQTLDNTGLSLRKAEVKQNESLDFREELSANSTSGSLSTPVPSSGNGTDPQVQLPDGYVQDDLATVQITAGGVCTREVELNVGTAAGGTQGRTLPCTGQCSSEPLAGGGNPGGSQDPAQEADPCTCMRATTSPSEPSAGDIQRARSAPAASGVKEPGPCKWIYVLDTHQRLYVHPKHRGKFHHSSFVQGGAVLAAGGLTVDHGRLIRITADSGHYKPNYHNFMAFVSLLESWGADLTSAKLTAKHILVPIPVVRTIAQSEGSQNMLLRPVETSITV